MNDLSAEDRSMVSVFDSAETANHEADSYWDALALEEMPFALLWGGNEHAVVFMLSDDPITIVGPRSTTSPARPGRVIPYRMVKALWRIWLTPLAQFLARHPAPAGITVLGTPPPKPEMKVRAGIAIEPHFVQVLAARGLTPEDAPVVDTTTRVAAWDALQECLHEVAAEGGANFLGVPGDVAGPDGTLLDMYCAPDATHANRSYGHRIWSHLLASLPGVAA